MEVESLFWSEVIILDTPVEHMESRIIIVVQYCGVTLLFSSDVIIVEFMYSLNGIQSEHWRHTHIHTVLL